MIGYPSPFVQVKGASVERRSLKRIKVILKRHPWRIFFAIVVFLGAALFFLLRSRWGKTVLIVLSTILSAEGGLALMRMAEWKFLWALLVIILSHVVNLAIDYAATVWLLKLPWFKSAVQIISDYGKIMIAKIAELLPWSKAEKSADVDLLTRIHNHLDDLHKRKSPWVYVVICAAAGIPKPIPLMPGWVAPAVFFIRYNKLGFRGWVPLCLGLAIRTTYDLAIAYGF